MRFTVLLPLFLAALASANKRNSIQFCGGIIDSLTTTEGSSLVWSGDCSPTTVWPLTFINENCQCIPYK